MSDRIETLKNLRSYRGQIYNVVAIAGRETKYSEIEFEKEEGPISRIPDILATFKVPRLYSYQGQLIRDLLDGCSVGLFAPVGSGKKTTIAAAAGLYAILAGKTVMIICENESEAEVIGRIFDGPIGRFIKVAKHDQSYTSLNITCDILITTDKKIKSLIYEDYDKVREWTSMLGLIVVSSLTSYSPQRISHVQGLLAFFDAATERGAGLRHLVTGEPIGNPLNVVNELTGREGGPGNKIYSDNGRGRNPYEMIAWLPPYTIDEKAGTQVIKRRDYYEELGVFFDLFRENKNILIWHSYAAIGKDKLGEWIGRYHSVAKITLINRLSDIQLSRTGLFDGLILMGFPKDPQGLVEALGNVLLPGSTVGIILPNDPFSHFVIKTDSWIFDLPYPEFITPEAHSFVSSAYLVLSAHLSGLTTLQKSGLGKPQLDGIKRNKRALSSSGFLLFEDENSFVLDSQGLKDRSKEWFIESHTADTLTVRIGSANRHFDAYLYPSRLFPGAIRYFGEIPYQMIKEGSGHAFAPLSGIAPVKRVPLLGHKVLAATAIDTFQGDFKITLSSAKLEISWQGFKEYRSFTIKPDDADVIESHNAETFQKDCYLFTIVAKSYGHEFSHLLRIWLPLFYSNFMDFYEIFHDHDSVYLYGLLPNENEARSLLLTLPSILRKVLGFSKDLLLYSCPSKDGCPFCLSVYDCPEKEEKTDKKAIIEQVLRQLKEKRDSLVKLKYEGLGHSEAQHCYEEIAGRILSVFEKKLDLVIANKVPVVAVRAETLSKKGCAGVFTGDSVQVIEKLDEANALEVIAHEYAHNWAKENMGSLQDIPSDMPADDKLKDMLSKLISEGFAQWVAFKMMDHFGLESSLAGIYLWDFDEYGEGFRVLYWLESHMGFQSVLDFVKNGKIVGDDGNEWGLNAVLEKSGYKARVLHWIMNKAS
ncbi:MAG: DEAD/DEAH box helicase family protein [Planctomycetes bacterium]|nr:DEAD/DEAH box helicase family protein [Planctomycetota bacterium]